MNILEVGARFYPSAKTIILNIEIELEREWLGSKHMHMLALQNQNPHLSQSESMWQTRKVLIFSIQSVIRIY